MDVNALTPFSQYPTSLHANARVPALSPRNRTRPKCRRRHPYPRSPTMTCKWPHFACRRWHAQGVEPVQSILRVSGCKSPETILWAARVGHRPGAAEGHFHPAAAGNCEGSRRARERRCLCVCACLAVCARTYRYVCVRMCVRVCVRAMCVLSRVDILRMLFLSV